MTQTVRGCSRTTHKVVAFGMEEKSVQTKLGVRIAVASVAFLFAACSSTPAVSQPPGQSQAAASQAPPSQAALASQGPDYLAMSWDQLTAQAKTEGEIVFSAWWGEEFWKEVAKEFTAKYGIEARILLGNNAIDKMLAEKDRAIGTIDVQLIGGADVKTSVDAGLWYGPVYPKLPDHGSIDQKLATIQEGVTTGGYLVPIYRNQTGFLYDPQKVATPPQTWDEFAAWVTANPKGFAYPDPNKGGTGQGFVQAVITSLTGGLDKYVGDTSVDPAKVANWNLAWDWLKANNPKMNVSLSNGEDIDLLNQGAASIVMAWDDDSQAAITNGTLFKRAQMYIPKFGLPGGGDTAGVVKNAPDKAAAILFLDFLTSPDIQKLMNKTVGSIPSRTDVTGIPSIIPEDVRAANGVAWIPAPYKSQLAKDFTSKVLLGQ
ncbi:MAG: putative spermidine/putrescine transport system substrate-binding protein [Chloroflexota bacterium]|nr:putative spermidine/putrescine transport system substrate-binding protein [Chloroflexota bacterium]